MKRECIPDEAINSMIKRDRVEVSLLILFCRFHFLCQFSFRFNTGSRSQKHWWSLLHFSTMFCYVTPVTLH